jgi:hypothetical protein
MQEITNLSAKANMAAKKRPYVRPTLVMLAATGTAGFLGAFCDGANTSSTNPAGGGAPCGVGGS